MKGDFVVIPLRQRMMEDLQIRNYAPPPIPAYVRGVAEFAKHFGKVTGPARGRADPKVSTVPDQKEGSGPAHLHKDR